MSYSQKTIVQARNLRQHGNSLGEIAQKLQISKSTASLWTFKEILTGAGKSRIKLRQDEARKRAFAKIAENRKRIMNEIIQNSQASFERITMTPELNKLVTSIFIWTEGEKGKFNRVSFTNSDPVMIGVFLYLFRNSFSLDENKFRALVHIHEYHNEDEILQFWSELTNIPRNQFYKSYLKPHTGKRIRENYMGSIHVSYSDYKVARELASLYNIFAHRILGA